MNKTKIGLLILMVLGAALQQGSSTTDKSGETEKEEDDARNNPRPKLTIRTYCSNFCETCNFRVQSCTKCGEGFYWDHDFKICALGLIDGCQVYWSKTVCATCKTGYRNLRGVCRACGVPRCGDCNSDVANCVQCKKGFTFSSTNSNGATCDLSCDVPNCLRCFNGNGKFCSQCEPGYRRSVSDKCEPCQITGCADCQANRAVCTNEKCVDGYYFYQKKCQKCPNGCRVCDGSGRCTACDTSNAFYMDQAMNCVKAANSSFMNKMSIALFFLLIIQQIEL